jgi:hypothetical protein
MGLTTMAEGILQELTEVIGRLLNPGQSSNRRHGVVSGLMVRCPHRPSVTAGPDAPEDSSAGHGRMWPGRGTPLFYVRRTRPCVR